MYRLIKRERQNGRLEFVIQIATNNDQAWSDKKTYDNLLAAKRRYEEYKHAAQTAAGNNILHETVID